MFCGSINFLLDVFPRWESVKIIFLSIWSQPKKEITHLDILKSDLKAGFLILKIFFLANKHGNNQNVLNHNTNIENNTSSFHPVVFTGAKYFDETKRSTGTLSKHCKGTFGLVMNITFDLSDKCTDSTLSLTWVGLNLYCLHRQLSQWVKT